MVSTLAITLLFALLFPVPADAVMGWRDVLFGSAVTAVLFKIGQYLQALDFTYGTTASAYGAAGSFVVHPALGVLLVLDSFYGAELDRGVLRAAGAPGPRPGSPGGWQSRGRRVE
jgi:membrane protein